MTMLPLISCICVTANRRTWLAQSIKYFDWQVYPNREMVILEDGDEMNWELALGLNYHYIPGRMSIGEKRNLACRLARGEILCLWDDDDYHGGDCGSAQTRSTGACSPTMYALLR